jgi:hypothetical protein
LSGWATASPSDLLGALSGLWKGRDFHDLNQAAINGEAMTDVFIGYNGSSHVTNDLMHFYQDPIGVLRVKSNRLHMRIDLAPLLGPISAHLFRPLYETAFERSRPRHVWRHQGEGSIDIPRVKGRVGCAEQLDLWCRLVRHK